MSRKAIYLDNAATTPIDSRVLREVNFHLKNTFGNVGSIHSEGVKAKKVLDESRRKVAGFLGAHSDEIVFTSGGTESNNLAIFGAFSTELLMNKKKHAITTKIEHSSVLECFKQLEKLGVNVTYLPVNSKGIIEITDLKKAIRPNTALISIHFANNEIGVIQPIKEISKAIRHFKNKHLSSFNFQLSTVKNQFPILHVDASQAPCYIDCNVESLGADLLTIDGHKIYGPKGVGALYVRRGINIEPMILGGGQEKDLRSGTENIALIAGLTTALEICAKEREFEANRLTKLRDLIYSDVLENIRIKLVLNGDPVMRLPNNINFSIRNVNTEFLTLELDARGIAVSTKSACLEGDRGSYVVQALGGESWRSIHTLRISLGRFTKKQDVEVFTKDFLKILKKQLISV